MFGDNSDEMRVVSSNRTFLTKIKIVQLVVEELVPRLHWKQEINASSSLVYQTKPNNCVHTQFSARRLSVMVFDILVMI